MEGFYVILDYDNSQFALNGNYITVDAIFKDPTGPSSGSSMIWIIVGSVVGVLILVAIVGFIIVRQKNRRL